MKKYLYVPTDGEPWISDRFPTVEEQIIHEEGKLRIFKQEFSTWMYLDITNTWTDINTK